MSSLSVKNLARFAAVAGVTLGLSACFRPLYGPTASGEPLQAVMASIDVPENQLPDSQSRLEHYLRSELIYDLDGSGIPSPKKYRLTMSYHQDLATPIVDATTGRAVSATLNGTLTYTLVTFDGSKTITKGTAISSATYDRTQQRFADVRAARDAEIRVAKDLAGQVRTQIAAALVTGT